MTHPGDQESYWHTVKVGLGYFHLQIITFKKIREVSNTELSDAEAWEEPEQAKSKSVGGKK